MEKRGNGNVSLRLLRFDYEKDASKFTRAHRPMTEGGLLQLYSCGPKLCPFLNQWLRVDGDSVRYSYWNAAGFNGFITLFFFFFLFVEERKEQKACPIRSTTKTLEAKSFSSLWWGNVHMRRTEQVVGCKLTTRNVPETLCETLVAGVLSTRFLKKLEKIT
jgi:hypothetical protein